MAKEMTISVLFVCLGNICRSPMAEAVFRHTVKSKNLEAHFDRIDSTGTSNYNLGERPDVRSIETCVKHGINDIKNHIAQQLKASDFDKFDYILCMDEDNLRNIKAKAPRDKKFKAQIHLFGEWDESGRTVMIEDPYYGGIDGFEYNFKQISSYSERFLDSLKLSK